MPCARYKPLVLNHGIRVPSWSLIKLESKPHQGTALSNAVQKLPDIRQKHWSAIFKIRTILGQWSGDPVEIDVCTIKTQQEQLCNARQLVSTEKQRKAVSLYIRLTRSIHSFDRICQLAEWWQASEAGASAFVVKQVRRIAKSHIKSNSIVLKRSQVCFKQFP